MSRGVWCCQFELSGDAGLAAVVPAVVPHRATRILVRLHGDPMGYLELPYRRDELTIDGVVAAAWERFEDRIDHHLRSESPARGDWRPRRRPPGPGPACPTGPIAAAPDRALKPVTAVICTRDRSAILDNCLRRLATVTYPAVEFLVVDNAPRDESTRSLVDSFRRSDARFRYVREARPGLSVARNRGLVEARGEYVAFTDDDVSVDPEWITGLVRGFGRRADAGCVTGLVCTASISNEAEAYFDARAASWSSRCAARTFDLAECRVPGPLYPYSAGIFGTGANFAFDRALLLALGGFDEALGAGTPTRGGEDLDMFVRVLNAGRAIVYEPSALVWHHHRADASALLRQMYGYGTGLGAFMAKLVAQRSTRGDVLRRVGPGLRRMSRIGGQTSARIADGAAPPRGVLLREYTGFAAGPLLYLRARRDSSRGVGEP